MLPLSYNIRSLLVRRTTTAGSALGIALVVFVLASSMMLSEGVQKTLGQSARPDTAIVLRKGSDNEMSSNVPDSAVGLILAAPGVKREMVNGASTGLGAGEIVNVLALERVGSSGQVSNVLVRGVPDSARILRPEVKLVAGRNPRSGTDEAMLGARLRGRFANADLGGSLELRKGRSVKIVGIFTAAGSSFESEIWGDVSTVGSAFGRQGSVSSVRVRLESPSKFEQFEAAVEQDKALGLEVQREETFLKNASENTTDFVEKLGTSIAVIFSLAAMLGAMITMFSSVANRQREVGTLRALGFPRRTILLSFVIEALLLSLVGGLIGVLAAQLMALVKFPLVNFATWSEIVFSFTPTPAILGQSLGFATAMGILGGLLPAIRAARIPPLRAIRNE